MLHAGLLLAKVPCTLHEGAHLKWMTPVNGTGRWGESHNSFLLPSLRINTSRPRCAYAAATFPRLHGRTRRQKEALCLQSSPEQSVASGSPKKTEPQSAAGSHRPRCRSAVSGHRPRRYRTPLQGAQPPLRPPRLPQWLPRLPRPPQTWPDAPDLASDAPAHPAMPQPHCSDPQEGPQSITRNPPRPPARRSSNTHHIGHARLQLLAYFEFA